MKIGIVGSGLVGATAAYAMVMSGVGREIVLETFPLPLNETEQAALQHSAATIREAIDALGVPIAK